MKKLKILISSIFHKREKSTVKPLIIGEYSQPYVLAQRMRNADLKHGQVALVDLMNVRIRTHAHMKKGGVEFRPHLYFCALGAISPYSVVGEGDYQPLPEGVELVGFDFDCRENVDSQFHLRNVKLYSNGHIQVIKTEETVMQRVPE